MKFKLGIIGAGVMANAILNRVIQSGFFLPKEITVFDIDSEKLQVLPTHKSRSVQELIDASEMVLFAVKPQHFLQICEDNRFHDDVIVLSIMAGVKIASLKKALKSGCGIARIMPNTPCSVGKGFCGLCFDSIKDEKKQIITDLFRTCGDIIIIEEEMFDTVTSISGSGPAYVFMFLDALIKGGMKGGLDYENSKKMAISTVIGASELAKSSIDNLDTMVDKVCSKGGTTIEAVNIYKEKELEEIIVSGIDACRKKSKILSENYA